MECKEGTATVHLAIGDRVNILPRELCEIKDGDAITFEWCNERSRHLAHKATPEELANKTYDGVAYCALDDCVYVSECKSYGN